MRKVFDNVCVQLAAVLYVWLVPVAMKPAPSGPPQSP